MKCPKILYRYMRFDHALSFIKDPWLKITPPNQFNDIYELTGRSGKKHDDSWNDMILEDRGARMAAANFLKQAFGLGLKQQNLLSFAKDQPKLWRTFMRYYNGVKTTGFAHLYPRLVSCTNGMVCFTESAENRLMWTHYADQFKGIVIGLETANNFFERFPLKRVRYTKKRTLFPMPNWREHSQRRPASQPKRQFVNFLGDDESLWLTKHIDYQYEREWRISLLLAHCRKRIKGLYFRRLPRSCVKEIIIGPRCAKTPQLIRAVEEHMPCVVVSNLSLHPTTFNFQFRLAE